MRSVLQAAAALVPLVALVFVFSCGATRRRSSQASDRRLAPLLDELGLTRGKRNSGAKLRFSLIGITETDFALIRDRMTRGA